MAGAVQRRGERWSAIIARIETDDYSNRRFRFVLLWRDPLIPSLRAHMRAAESYKFFSVFPYEVKSAFRNFSALFRSAPLPLLSGAGRKGLKRAFCCYRTSPETRFCIVCSCPLDKKRAWSILKNCGRSLDLRHFSPSKKSEKRRKTGEKEKTEKRASMEAVKASIIMSYKCEKMVGMARFELATFCPPDKRANQAALHPDSIMQSDYPVM